MLYPRAVFLALQNRRFSRFSSPVIGTLIKSARMPPARMGRYQVYQLCCKGQNGRKPQQRHKKCDSYNSYEQILFCFWFHEKNPFPELMAEICKENVCELFFVL